MICPFKKRTNWRVRHAREKPACAALTRAKRSELNAQGMAATVIPDGDLLAQADFVTVWVASPDAPTDVWSLSEAISWAMSQPSPTRLTLFRPPGNGVRAAWVDAEQIERLAFALGVEPVSSAA